ncbi:hypothetical protein KAR50_08845 [Periweissella fabaria]|uniref:Uncharacterized protein n=1 Tax=Periweissella fabaria TaxID=546157 RepID=A0ABM8Z7Z1_9LACO|nr:hypothetical protein [Periweissella fabaria]MCM0597940.1 hypothetical protein [Periweissella fabaria]CAH0417459.1 hypothetical protein WFA24289_01800 [Periweissella fabaria]
MKDYFALLEAVRNGEITEFEVTVDEFTAFHQIWQAYQYQNQISGAASRGGSITYTQQVER